MKKKVWTKGFSSFLLFYALAILGISVVAMVILWGTLRDYEGSMPIYKAQEYMEQVDAQVIRDMILETARFEVNDFEEIDPFIEEFLPENLEGRKIEFQKGPGSTKDVMVYVVVADQDPMFQFVMHKDSDATENPFGVWNVTKVECLYQKILSPEYDVTITIPEDIKVLVNGKLVGDEYCIDKEGTIPFLEPVIEFVQDVPKMLTYHIDGFYEKPVVTYQDANGSAKEVLQNEDGTYGYAFLDESLQDTMSEWIQEMTQMYGRRISKDATFTDLAPYLLKGSAIYEYMRTGEFNWYAKHDSYEFKDWTIDGYKKYSDTCFSVDVDFTQLVYRKGNVSEYISDITWTCVQTDGKWYVAAMQINGGSSKTNWVEED